MAASTMVRVGSVKGDSVVRFHGNKSFKTEGRKVNYKVVRIGKGGMSVIRSNKTGKVYSVPLTQRVFVTK